MLSTKQHRDKKWNPYSRQLAHSDEAYPGFLSMKQIGVLQLPSRGILVNHIVTTTTPPPRPQHSGFPNNLPLPICFGQISNPDHFTRTSPRIAHGNAS